LRKHAGTIFHISGYKKFNTAGYTSCDSDSGREIEEGRLSLENLRASTIENDQAAVRNGRHVHFENIINRFL